MALLNAFSDARCTDKTISHRSPHARITVIGCLIYLSIFAGLSWSAVETKNSTIDEPIHAISGWVALRYHDYRLVPESPSLWQCWAALPNWGQNLTVQFDSHVWKDPSFDSQDGINWTNHTLYETPGNDGEAFVRRSRVMMLLLGVALGATIGLWTYRLSGAVAALAAVGLFSFDPNFLAHSPIVKSDVPLALVMLALSQVLWRLGYKASIGRVVLAGVFCGIAINVKFSGLLLLPILTLLLAVRVFLPSPWRFGSQSISTMYGRLALATGILAMISTICVGVIWASYGFRFRPAPSLTSGMDMRAIRARAVLLETAASNPTHDPTVAELSAYQPSLIVCGVDFANKHRLLPQAMLGGLLYQHACLQIWQSYLLGRLYGIGRWYYYPSAMVFKTPLATLCASGIALPLALICLGRHRKGPSIAATVPIGPGTIWSAACLLIPPVLFAVAAMNSNLDIGLRSVLPIYPYLFIGLGLAAAKASRLGPKSASVAIGLLLAGLLAETLSAWPNYISFFNGACGGARGGFALLGDSNLDWGQDMKPLVAWQRSNPKIPMYLHYFGSVSPEFLGLSYHPFEVAPNGSALLCDVPMKPGVIAVSTNYLQGLHDTPADRTFFRQLGLRVPDAVVGKSIYLYHYPLRR